MHKSHEENSVTEYDDIKRRFILGDHCAKVEVFSGDVSSWQLNDTRFVGGLMDDKLKRAYVAQTLDFHVRMERAIADGRVMPQTIEDIEREYAELKASILKQAEFEPFVSVFVQEPERPQKGRWRGLNTLIRLGREGSGDALTRKFEV